MSLSKSSLDTSILIGDSVGGPFCSWSTLISVPGIPFMALRKLSKIGLVATPCLSSNATKEI